jgi:PAS domain S-box-containing protein
VEKVFGYSRAELLGQPVETLIPERFRSTHPNHRTRYGAHRTARPMGAGLELYGQRKEGSEFPVDIMLGPIEGAESSVVLAVIRDLSQKKEAEEALQHAERQNLYLEQELEITHQFEEIVG